MPEYRLRPSFNWFFRLTEFCLDNCQVTDLDLALAVSLIVNRAMQVKGSTGWRTVRGIHARPWEA